MVGCAQHDDEKSGSNKGQKFLDSFSKRNAVLHSSREVFQFNDLKHRRWILQNLESVQPQFSLSTPSWRVGAWRDALAALIRNFCFSQQPQHPLGQSPSTHWRKWWMGPITGLETLEREQICTPAENRTTIPRTSSRQPSYCIDWATPTPKKCSEQPESYSSHFNN